MLDDLEVSPVSRSRVDQVDFANLGFGDIYSDHMFSMEYEGGCWQRPRIMPYGPVSLEPANATLHYGQSVFEGLKAFRGKDGNARIFRPRMNHRRLLESCKRLCVPPVPEAVFLEAIDRLVRMDQAWIPEARGQALYVRPIIFSTEAQLEVRPSATYRFLVITAPVRAYFDAGMAAIALKVEESYTRSAPGGTGYAKTAGNYAASLYPGEVARSEGYAQVLWLDGVEHRYVEEVGAMNIFFHLGDRIVTPELRGTILPGITRESVIALLEDRGYTVEQRRIAIDELAGAIKDGTLREAFGAGTAAIISPVGRMAYRDEELVINDDAAGPLTRELYDAITDIQRGESADRHGWVRVVKLNTPAGERAAP